MRPYDITGVKTPPYLQKLETLARVHMQQYRGKAAAHSTGRPMLVICFALNLFACFCCSFCYDFRVVLPCFWSTRFFFWGPLPYPLGLLFFCVLLLMFNVSPSLSFLEDVWFAGWW